MCYPASKLSDNVISFICFPVSKIKYFLQAINGNKKQTLNLRRHSLILHCVITTRIDPPAREGS